MSEFDQDEDLLGGAHSQIDDGFSEFMTETSSQFGDGTSNFGTHTDAVSSSHGYSGNSISTGWRDGGDKDINLLAGDGKELTVTDFDEEDYFNEEALPEHACRFFYKPILDIVNYLNLGHL